MPYNKRLDSITTAYCKQICQNHEKQKKKQVRLHRNGYNDSDTVLLGYDGNARRTCKLRHYVPVANNRRYNGL